MHGVGALRGQLTDGFRGLHATDDVLANEYVKRRIRLAGIGEPRVREHRLEVEGRRVIGLERDRLRPVQICQSEPL